VGDNEQTLVWLEKAYAQHSNGLTALKVDPVYDPLRGDPRFQRLLAQVGLAQ
jgi:serine/threonine-protein kinase